MNVYSLTACDDDHCFCMGVYTSAEAAMVAASASVGHALEFDCPKTGWWEALAWTDEADPPQWRTLKIFEHELSK